MVGRISFVAALKQFFGFKDGQSASDFMREIRQLTQKDKNELYEDMQKGGVVCDPPTGYSS